ncbi:hypothetical protein BDV06DRAFT_225743 [Aspergillus oleicola]
MSRNIFPVAMAIVFGVATGYYTFQPELKNYHTQKAGEGVRVQDAQQQQQAVPTPAPASTNTSTPKDTSGK